MDHGDHGDSPQRFIDLVDHAVGATAGAMSVPQRWVQSFSHPLWVVEQGANDEVVCRKRHRLG